MWKLNFQREIRPNGLTFIFCFPKKQIDVSQSNIRETAVTVNKIEREEYCRAYGLSQL